MEEGFSQHRAHRGCLLLFAFVSLDRPQSPPVPQWAKKRLSLHPGRPRPSRIAPPRHHSPPALLLDITADALLHTVCHSLSAREHVRFARTSKRMYALAQYDFSWAHAPTVIIRSTALVNSPRPLSPLLRFAPIALNLRHSSHAALLINDDTRLHIRELDGAHCEDQRMSWSCWVALLSNPSLARCRVLAVDASPDPTVDAAGRFAACLWSLRDLRSLSLSTYGRDAPSPPECCLTSLELRYTPGASQSTMQCIASSCSSLRSLHMVSPSLNVRQFFCPPSSVLGATLMQLTLAAWRPMDPPQVGELHPTAQDFADAFASLTQLRVLNLDVCYGVSAILPALAQCPALRMVQLAPELDPAWDSPLTFPGAKPMHRCLPRPRDFPSSS